jgi:hypothetical protein
MAYGSVKVDTIIFDNGGSDQNVTVSGLYRATTSGVTVTGTISGAVLVGTTTVSGATVTGNVVQGTTVQGISGTFTSLTGTTTTGTTANFASGVFTTRVSGTIITGDTGQFTSGTFVSLTGTTITGTTIDAVTVSSTTGTFTSLTGTTITGTTINGVTVAATTGSFTSLTGTTTSGTTANFVSGVFTTQISGATVTGTTANFTSGNFTNISGGTQTVTSGVFAAGSATNPSISFASDPNSGLFSPGADQVAISTNGTERTVIDSSGRLLVGTSNARTNLGPSINTAPRLQVEGTTVSTASASITRNVDSAGDANFSFVKTRAAIVGGLNAVIANDALGTITFQGSDGVNFYRGASITALVDGTPGTADMPGRLTFLTTPSGAGTPTERMRIDSSGRVGIGTTTSSTIGLRLIQDAAGADLTVVSANWTATTGTISNLTNFSASRSTAGATITNLFGFNATSILTSATNNYGFYADLPSGTGRWNFYANGTADSYFASNNFIWANGGTERARIDSSGRLLVGTSSYIDVWNTAQNLILAGGANKGIGIASAGGPCIVSMVRSSGTDPAAFGLVANDDILGVLNWNGGDGSTRIGAARIQAAVDGTPGASDMPGRLVFMTTADGGSGPTERARITSTGAVLVGTTSTPTGAGSGAVVAEDRVVISSAGAGRHQTLAGSTGIVTATTGTVVFKFKYTGGASHQACLAKLSISQRANSSTTTNSPHAEYAFQLFITSGGVCSLNGAATIFEYTYVRATHLAFADLGGGECTVTLTNPTANALSGAYKIELLANAGAWTLETVTTT